MRKRILGLLLTLCMMLSVLPLPIFAADANLTYKVTINGGENGTLLKDGTAVAGNSATIDIEESGRIPDNYTIKPNEGYLVKEFETLTKIAAVDVRAGNNHTVVLMANGTVWACGQNDYGQLGDGTTENRDTYVQMKDDKGPITNVTAISAGGRHTVVLKADGTVWACGQNTYGQLGNASTKRSSTFVQMNITNVTAISAGGNHTVVLKEDGTVWACGQNTYGQLGNTSTTNSSAFVQMKDANGSITDITAIAAGGEHTVVLKKNSTVWTCGRNNYGQLGIETTTPSFMSSFVQTGKRSLKITAIAAGDSHTLILTDSGQLWTCGRNYYGQLGTGSWDNDDNPNPAFAHSISSVKAIAAGGNHSVILKTDGTVWACGDNKYGRLGIGDNSSAKTGSFRQTSPTSSDYTAIAAGSIHTVALKKDGIVWTCGDNNYGQLGIDANHQTRIQFCQSGESTLDSVVTVGTAVSLADITITNKTTITPQYVEAKTVTISGGEGGVLNKDGKAVDGNRVTLEIPVGEKLPAGYTLTSKKGYNLDVLERKTKASVIDISAGSYDTVVLMSNGTVWACGNTINASSFVQLKDSNGYITDAAAISAGYGYTVILKKDGTVWACGKNDFGQLGNGSANDSRSSFVQMQYSSGSGTAPVTDVAAIAAGDYHTVILKKDGTVWACGYNYYGQLGNGSTANSSTLVQMKDSNGVVTDATAITVGAGHTVVLKKDGTVWACGENDLGQLGNNSTTNSSTLVQMKDSNGVVTDATAIAAGAWHTVILRNGAAWACGSDKYYQLGINSQLVAFKSVLVQMMDNKGVVTDATAVAAGAWHTVVLRADGTVWVCGYGTDGRLGLGNTTGKLVLGQMLDSTSQTIENVAAIAAGSDYTLVLKADGTVWACGNNRNGQLGTGESGSNKTTLTLSGEGVLDSVYTITAADSLSDITVDDNMELTAQWYMMGDVTGSKTVDIRDLVRLKRYLAGQSIEIHKKSTDLKKDDIIDKNDLAELKKLLVK